MAATATPTKTTAPSKAAAEKRALAEAAKFEAEAELARANAAEAVVEREIAQARLRQEQATAAHAEIVRRSAEREEAEYLATDRRNHVYNFFSDVTGTSVTNCIATLASWSRLEPGCPITIIFNSPGGSVIHGMALWDFLTELKGKGHHLTTVACGYAASMAGILLQVGDTRVIGRESYLMIHELSAGAAGKIGEIQDSVKFYEKVGERIIDLFVKRSGGKTSRAVFIKNWLRQDWWLSSDEVMQRGFADEVA